MHASNYAEFGYEYCWERHAIGSLVPQIRVRVRCALAVARLERSQERERRQGKSAFLVDFIGSQNISNRPLRSNTWLDLTSQPGCASSCATRGAYGGIVYQAFPTQ